MRIIIDDLSGPEIAAFLEEHLADMRSASPPESKHALDLQGLRAAEITFWTVWEEEVLVGCAALGQLDSRHVELKSMRTAPAYHRRGIASRLLEHLLSEARQRGYRRMSLETGTMAYFEPARRLYAKFGFEPSPPFSHYVEDPYSLFMSKEL